MRLAAGVEGSSPVLNISIFAVFVVITLGVVLTVNRRRANTASDLCGCLASSWS